MQEVVDDLAEYFCGEVCLCRTHSYLKVMMTFVWLFLMFSGVESKYGLRFPAQDGEASTE